jgi:hypothetical protein
MKRVAMVFLAVVALAASAFAQGRLSKDGDPGNPDRPQRRAAAMRGSAVNAMVPGKPMRLIASALSVEDFEVNPDEININADEKHRVFSTLIVNVPADASRTYLFVCASATGFWQQVPSDSSLIFSPVLLVRFETPFVDGGVMYEGYDIPDRRREFEPSTKTVNHTPYPFGCGTIDEPSMVLYFTTYEGMSNADALAAARTVIKSSMKLTVGFNIRMQSVGSFGLSDPGLAVWSD